MCDTIGTRIGQLREERNMTQIELAKALGVKRETVTQWENGSRDIKTKHTVMLASFFGVSTDYLLCCSNVKKPDTTLQAIGAYTGLSDKAILMLHNRKEYSPAEIDSEYQISFVSFINYLLEDEEIPHDGYAVCLLNVLWQYISSYTPTGYELVYEFESNDGGYGRFGVKRDIEISELFEKAEEERIIKLCRETKEYFKKRLNYEKLNGKIHIHKKGEGLFEWQA